MSFLNALLKTKLENADCAFDLKYDGAATTSARTVKKIQKQSDGNIIDNNLPSIEGYLLSIEPAKSTKVQDLTLTVLITKKPKNFENSPHVFELPGSGAVVQLAVERWPNKAKDPVSVPHYFSPIPNVVEIGGIVQIQVKPAGNGPRGSDLKVGSYPPSTYIELSGVVFETKQPETTDKYVGVWGRASGFSYVKEAFPVHERTGKLIEAMLNESPSLQRQMAHSYSHLTATPVAKLVADAQADAAFLAEVYPSVLSKHADGVVRAGDVAEMPLLAPGCETAIPHVAALLHQSQTNLKTLLDVHQCFDVEGTSKNGFSGARKLTIPIVQTAITPSNDVKCAKRAKTGHGMLAFGAVHFPEFFVKRPDVLADMVLQPSPDKLNADKTKDLRAFVVDCVAVNVLTRNHADGGDEWDVTLPKVAGGAPLVPKQFTISAKAGVMFDLKNTLGLYDFRRLPDVFHTLLPYASVFFMPKHLTPPVSGPNAENQPGLADEDYGASGFKQLIDFKGAIETVGIRVSDSWVVSVVPRDDDDDLARTPEEPIQYFQTLQSGEKLRPSPPKFATHGYQCLNGTADNDIKKLLKKTTLPPKTALEFYVVFEGCDKIKNHARANEDPVVGEQAIKDAFKTTDEDALAEAVAKYAGVYAVVVSTSKSDRGESSDTENKEANDDANPSKKAKAASDDEE